MTTCTRGWYLCIEFKIVCNDHDYHDDDNDDDEKDEEGEVCFETVTRISTQPHILTDLDSGQSFEVNLKCCIW